MGSKIKGAVIALVSLTIGGCQTAGDEAPIVDSKVDITPATLTQKTAQAHQELEMTVAKALGVAKVTLATEALMGESTLSVQQKPQMGPDGNPIMGRIMKRPDHFTLQSDGQSCSLVHDETGNVYTLKSVVCERVTP